MSIFSVDYSPLVDDGDGRNTLHCKHCKTMFTFKQSTVSRKGYLAKVSSNSPESVSNLDFTA